jgi:signal transduction histidine kinase
MSTDELRDAFLTSGLTDEQRAELVAVSDEVTYEPDQVLYVEGEPADHLWILLDGAVEVTRRSANETVALATMSTPGQWAGGLRAWGGADSGAGYMTSGRGVEAGRCLRVPSGELSRLVTEWFPFGKHIIDGLWQTVRGMETMARERDSLVSLGTMAAGLAHEINNPAAASVRAVEALGTACDDMLSSLTRLGEHTITAEQFMTLDALRVEASQGDTTNESSLASADREEAVGQWLDGQGVTDAWTVAPVLAAAGVGKEWCERVEAAVGPASLDPAVHWAAATLNASSLLGEIADTTTRISQLVDAVKSYSQMDRAARQRIDVHDGLASTLVMLGHKLRDVEVARSFGDDVPELDAYPGELNQVWTNLIDNAIDAMDGRGSLAITTRLDADDLVIDIADTGPGMSEQVKARAFEPFFTTKDVGKGTGLGLDISRRIVVDRHGGEITFDSSGSGTTAHVRLPLTG